MPHWSPLRGRSTGEWLGASVFVLAVCLGVGWATALIMSASSRTPPITDSTKDLLSTVEGGLVGVIGMEPPQLEEQVSELSEGGP